MEIITASLDTEQVKQLNGLQRKLGYKSRSKLLRAAIDSLLHEHAQIDGLTGFQNTVITVSHRKEDESGVMRAMHQFEDLVETNTHKQSGGRCVEIIMAQGDAGRIKRLYGLLKAAKGVDCVNCFVL